MSLHRVRFVDPETDRRSSATFYDQEAWERFADLVAANGYESVQVEDVANDGRVVYRPHDSAEASQ